MRTTFMRVLAVLLVISSLSTTFAASQGAYPAYSGNKKMAVIMLSWQDRGCPASRQTVVDRIWNNSNSLRKYYLDMSRNAMDFVPPADAAPDGTVSASTTAVYGPYELSVAAGFTQDVTVANAETLYGGNYLYGTHSVAETLAAVDGFDWANYDYVMYITPKAATTGGMGGYAGVNANYSHMFDIRQNYVNHEIGHNLGLSHSNTNVDQDGYGSQDCVMGNGANAHLDGVHTYNMGWYPDANFSAESFGQYTIENLAEDTDNLKVLRFDRGAHGATANPTYNLWVGYRKQGVGQDVGLNGNWNRKVNIHYCNVASPRPSDPSNYYYYLNNNVAWFDAGGSYTDPDSLCTVRFLRHDDSGNASATVQFIDPSGNQPPTLDPNQHLYVGIGTNLFSVTTTDPENDTLSYTVIQNVSTGTLVNNNTGTFTYTGSTLGTYTFILRVNDGQYDSYDETITFSVVGAAAPLVNAGPDQTVNLLASAYSPGLYFGEVSGDIDETTPNPNTVLITDVASKTEDSIGGNTTEIFTGQIFDADGQMSFTEQIDDKTRIWIDGTLVLTSNSHSDRVSSGNLALTPGWHDIEIRISNGGGGSGPLNSPGVGFDPAGGTTWQTLADPGDASFLRVLVPDSAIANLNGTTSDADGDVLTNTWSVVDGPATVNFGSSSSVNTSAGFSVPGVYTLRLTATDGINQTYDDINLTVVRDGEPEISVFGNSVEIASGDAAPSAADGTYFGTVSGGSNSAHTFRITNFGGSDLTLSGNPIVTLTGSSAFSVTAQPTSPISSLGTTDVTITFSPADAEAHTATVTLSSNDTDEPTYTFDIAGNKPTVTVSATDANANEAGPDTGEWTLTRTGGTAADLTVLFSLSGTATDTTDYTTSVSNQVVIPAGQASATVTLTPVTDSDVEPTETAILTITDDVTYLTGAASATISLFEPDSVQVTSPNGGESFAVGLVPTIAWASLASGNVKIDLLKGGVLDSVIAASTPNDGSHAWTIPGNMTASSDCRVRITLLPGGTVLDTSDADFSIILDPLAEAVDAPSLAWSTSGDVDWFSQTATTHDGVDAAENGNIDDSQSSHLETTVTSPGTLTFWWKVSSESGYDYLTFYLNGVEQTGSLSRISGTVDWVQKTVTIPSGSTTVRWSYSKDGSVSNNADTAWVDQVVYTPSNIAPVIVSAPWADTDPLTLPASTNVNVVASDADAGDTLTYTWSKVSGPGTATFVPNGTDLSDVSSAGFSAAGTYTLQVTVDDQNGGTVAGTVEVVVNPAPTLDHFAFSSVSAPQTVGVPFSVTITAKFSDGTTDTSYSGTPTLVGVRSDSSTFSVTPAAVTFTGGVATVNVTVNEATTGMKLNVSE